MKLNINNLTFILLTVLICSCTKQQKHLEWQEACGKVKSIRTTGYEANEKFGEIKESYVLYDDDINNLIEFNKDGCITEISNFNNRGDLIKRSIYVYDNDGNVVKINIYDGEGDEIGRTVYTYNADNEFTKIVDYKKVRQDKLYTKI